MLKLSFLLVLVIITAVCIVNQTGAALIHWRKRDYVLAYPNQFGNRFSIPADNPLTQDGVNLGRALFYEPLLSSTSKVSCATCHQQKKAFTDGKKFSTGVDNVLTSRNAMSLSNLLWVKSFFWDGRAESLEKQAEFPLTNVHEMGQDLSTSAAQLQQTALYTTLFTKAFGTDSITGERITKALAQFERTMISANSRYDQYLQGRYQPTPQELNGLKLFTTFPQPAKGIRGADCIHCHQTPKTFSDIFHNNGLDSLPKDSGRAAQTHIPADLGRFRVPTLRNIALTAPYMHDGRFNTLEEVLDHYSEHIQKSGLLSPVLQNNSNKQGGVGLFLTPDEKKDIISFLHLLTDSTFISDPRFANPYITTK